MSKNLSAKYYQENKGYFQKYFLQKKTCKRYKNLSKEEKKKATKNLSEDEKYKLVECR